MIGWRVPDYILVKQHEQKPMLHEVIGYSVDIGVAVFLPKNTKHDSSSDAFGDANTSPQDKITVWERRIRTQAIYMLRYESPGYRIPESFRAFCRMVSLTAANTNLTLPVSVA